jgi:hypothetical protein
MAGSFMSSVFSGITGLVRVQVSRKQLKTLHTAFRHTELSQEYRCLAKPPPALLLFDILRLIRS